ncbi:hypothetical protein EC973_004287 [Apophysomyces ossiformis]|uniref:Protein bir1 n=1 Tax=Apophysomyces ossiformis TaxID=679940 RepID=A0A8H7BKE4_9FUNG|nr:hypothetical protein EC973_004287 [Apophysomyces ossiformis]
MERHEKESPECPWVVLRFPDTNMIHTIDDNDPATHPKSSKMRNARLMTFTKKRSWPRGRSLITASKLADAGFYYSPTVDTDDRASCIYCHCTMRGSDRTTRPLARHQEMQPDCLFFKKRKVRGSLPSEHAVVADTDDSEDWATASSEVHSEAGSSHRKSEGSVPLTRQSARLQSKMETSRKRKFIDEEQNDEGHGQDQETSVINEEQGIAVGKSPFDDSIWDIDKAFEKQEKNSVEDKRRRMFTYSKRQRKKTASILPDDLTNGIENQESHPVASQGSYISKIVIDNSASTTPNDKERDQSKQAQAKLSRDKGKGKEITPVQPTKKVLSLSKTKTVQTKETGGRSYLEAGPSEPRRKPSSLAESSRPASERPLSLEEATKNKMDETGEKSSINHTGQGPSKASASAHPTTQDRLEFPYMDDDLDDDLASFNVSPIRPEGEAIVRWSGFPAGGILHSTPITSTERRTKTGFIFPETGPAELLRRRSPPKSPTRSYQEKRQFSAPEKSNNLMKSSTPEENEGKPMRLTKDQLKMTVEEYLRSLVDKEIEAVKKRGEEQIEEIENYVKQIRQELLSSCEKSS